MTRRRQSLCISGGGGTASTSAPRRGEHVCCWDRKKGTGAQALWADWGQQWGSGRRFEGLAGARSYRTRQATLRSLDFIFSAVENQCCVVSREGI